MKKTVLSLSAVLVLVGCGSHDKVTQETEGKESSGYVENLGDINTDARKEIAAAQKMQQEKIDEAMKIAEGNSVEDNLNNDNTMDVKIAVPESVDISLAETCSGATITTNKGVVEVAFYGADAPVTVANFCSLAKDGFYEGVIFHRVIPDFMIQGGDPTGTGTGGPDYKFGDEFNDRKIVRGSLAMANAGPSTNGSQFFIVTAEATPHLDGRHTNFGEVVSGMDVVDAIEVAETGPRDKPVEDIVIESVTLIQK